MNRTSKLQVAVAVMSAALAGGVTLLSGCTSMNPEPELAPTTYIAVAPLDLPEDYSAPSDTVYVPVAPLDLPNDYYASTVDSDGEEVVLAANGWMTP